MTRVDPCYVCARIFDEEEDVDGWMIKINSPRECTPRNASAEVKCNECRVAELVAKKITNACRGIIWGRWMDGWAEDVATRGEGHTIWMCDTRATAKIRERSLSRPRFRNSRILTTSETGFCLTPVSSSTTSHMRASTDAAAVGPSSKSVTFSRCRIFIDGG